MRQCHLVADALCRQGISTDIIGLTTQGDRVLDRPLAEVGGKELFIKELQAALRDGRADVAVHSLKDMAAKPTNGFILAAVGFAEDARDAVVGSRPLSALPAGATVGTSSPRRAALLARHYPHLRAVSVRGNVRTRLEKLSAGKVDALLLAAAGLRRLELSSRIHECLSPDQFVPAVGQGVLALECLTERAECAEALASINEAAVMRRIRAERAFSAAMGGDCTAPLAAHAIVADDEVTLSVFFATPEGRYLDATVVSSDPEAAGRQAAQEVLAGGTV